MAESRRLNILIEARDNASKQLKGLKGKINDLQPAFRKMAMVGTATAGIVGTGLYKMTQDASDAQEIFNKFDVVFGDVSEEAQKTAMDLRNNFGLAESSAKDLLSATGDMLTGFGLSGDMALDLAGKTNKLAVDLASFTNIEGGAERANKALTKALLGERESVKELGIAILEEDVKAKVKSMEATGELTDETDRQKRAYATLEIAMSQSKNAIGDFARTQDSLANKQRVLQQRIKEVKETIGRAFIPVLREIVAKVEPVIKKISEWVSANPELTKKIGLAAIAITGLIGVIGLLGIALPVIITGFSALAGPVGIAIGVITALAFLFKGKLIDAFKDGGKNIRDFFQMIDEKTGIVDILKTAWDNIVLMFTERLLPALQRLWDTLTPLKPYLEIFAKVLGVILFGALLAVFKIIEYSLILAIEGLTRGIEFAIEAIDFFKKRWEGTIDTIAKVINWVSRLISKIKQLNILEGARNAASKVFGGGRASGGPVKKGTSYIVGEEGPELFTPNKSGNIVPNAKLSKGGVSGGTTVNITVNGDVSGEELVEKVSQGIMRNLSFNSNINV